LPEIARPTASSAESLTPYVTVREALGFPALSSVRLRAGRSGLDNRITGVNIIEVPEVLKWLRGGELLFTAFYAFRDDPEAQTRLVRDLAAKGVAALAIKPGPYLPEVPEYITVPADQAGLPVLELPPDIPYMDIARPILQAVMSNLRSGVPVLEGMYHRLLDLVLAGSGLEALCRFISQGIERPVVIFDPDFNPVTAATPSGAQAGDWPGEVVVRKLPGTGGSGRPVCVPCRFPTGQTGELALFTIPVNGGETGGYLAVAPDHPGRVRPELADVLAAASRVIGLELIKDRALAGRGQQLATSLLEELLFDRPSLKELTYQKARMLGVDLKENYVVIVFRVAPPGGSALLASLPQGLQPFFHARSPGPGRAVVVSEDPEHVAAITNCEPGHEVSRLQAVLTRYVEGLAAGQPPLLARAGISRVTCRLEAFRNAHEQALQAVAAHTGLTPRPVVAYASLGVQRLLNELAGSSMLADFCQDTVAPLVAYDQEHGSELCRTAEVYLASGMSLRRSAEVLHIHKNTLLYRLKRIEEVSGYRLSDPDSCFELHLALRTRHLVTPALPR
jgi:purine catabolism regulator